MALALAFAGAGVFAFLQSGKASEAIAAEERHSAERAAEAVASKLTLDDVDGSMSPTLAQAIASFVDLRLLDADESVTVWNEDGVVVFARDASLIGTQDRRYRALIARVLSGGTLIEHTDGSLHTLVPVSIGIEDRAVVVAELIGSDDAFASAGRPWIYAAAVSGVLAFLALLAALRVSGAGHGGSRASTRGADLRRAHKSLQIAERALEQARTEETRLREELERVTGDLGASREALAAREASIDGAEARAQEAQASLETLQREMAELGARYEESAARAAHAEAEVLDLDVVVRELETTRAHLESERAEHAETQEQLEAFTRELEAGAGREGDLRTELGAARGELEQALADHDAATRRRLEEAHEQAESAQAALASTSDRLDATTRELDGSRKDLAALREDLAATQVALAAARAELETARARADGGRAELASVLETFDAIRTQHAATTSALVEARKELSASESALRSSRLDLETVGAGEKRALAEAAEARAAFDAVSARLSTAHEEAESAGTQVRALTDRMDEHAERAARAEARVFELSEQIHDLESRRDLAPVLEDAGEELEAARQDLRERDAQLAAARIELLAARTSARAAGSRADALESTIATMRSELRARQDAEARVDTAEARAAEMVSRAEASEARSSEDAGRAEAAEARAMEMSERAQRAEGLVTELAARAEAAETRADELAARAEGARAADASPSGEASRLEAPHTDQQLGWLASAASRRSQDEAAEARERLAVTQDALARLQDLVERGAELEPSVPEPARSASAAAEVAGTLSRDARRSLEAISGLARTLSTHEPKHEDARLLQQLMTHAERVEHAVEDLLDADRLTRGEPVLRRRSTEIDTLVRRVVRDFPLADDRRLEVSLETATIQVDAARIERLLDDLLTTAVARTGPGDRIGLRLQRTTEGVLISVEDGRPGEPTLGPAASFLAGLHGGWARAESAANGTGVVRAFLPGGVAGLGPAPAEPESAPAG